jgi:hypothetical protein
VRATGTSEWRALQSYCNRAEAGAAPGLQAKGTPARPRDRPRPKPGSAQSRRPSRRSLSDDLTDVPFPARGAKRLQPARRRSSAMARRKLRLGDAAERASRVSFGVVDRSRARRALPVLGVVVHEAACPVIALIHAPRARRRRRRTSSGRCSPSGEGRARRLRRRGRSRASSPRASRTRTGGRSPTRVPRRPQQARPPHRPSRCAGTPGGETPGSAPTPFAPRTPMGQQPYRRYCS